MMREVMLQNDGVGLAAPQIGLSKRVFVAQMELDGVEVEGIQSLPFTVFFNPKLTPLGEKKFENAEGCLSVEEGSLMGLVDRHHKVQVKFQNEEGKHKTMVAEGFFAGLVQHEYDHLNGILFTDHEVKYEDFTPSVNSLLGSFRYE
eukprot:CAMPEP_0201515984 /NCGR_PEP_ID=MMETSP0161_2-20130828/7415_1 /ASSEMBLY_ACC=CAM_ASM_000251 /TAXON_ID=180227 /ORGANISM="Neoparamoeba aestuarina, Strain SoJaBio B1-5/56/2" /LENGTH=145 /DNA_ID=CAMNT_0047912951 /DNA_START=206 /DNA_END=643 /DNA_ORIENTATION=-